MPASSGSRESPEVKKRQANAFSITPFGLQRFEPDDLLVVDAAVSFRLGKCHDVPAARRAAVSSVAGGVRASALARAVFDRRDAQRAAIGPDDLPGSQAARHRPVMHDSSSPGSARVCKRGCALAQCSHRSDEPLRYRSASSDSSAGTVTVCADERRDRRPPCWRRSSAAPERQQAVQASCVGARRDAGKLAAQGLACTMACRNRPAAALGGIDLAGDRP